MKKLSLIFVFAIVFGIVLSNTSFAQTSGDSVIYTVATVNIYNAKIVSNNERDYKISFDLSNDSGVQSQVRYSVVLTKTLADSDVVVDEKVYDSNFSIDQKITIPQSIDYSISSSLGTGDYKLWIYSKNNNGLVLAAAYIGEIKLTSNIPNTIEIIPESCYITIKNNASSSKYYLGDFAGIALNDSLIMNCIVLNRYTSDISLTPQFETRIGSVYGETTSQVGGTLDSIIIKNGKNNIKIDLPKVLTPQVYTNTFSLISNDQKISTNKIISSYALDGGSGSIMNTVLDKTSYNKGEIANLKIYSVITPSMSTSTLSGVSLSISIINKDGKSCSEIINKETISKIPVTEVQVPITGSCIDPKANITLSAINKIGEKITLDTESYNITTPKEVATPINYKQIAIVLAILIVLIFIFVLIKRKVSVIKVVSFIIISSGFILGMANKAEALTTVEGCTLCHGGMTFTYSLDKAIYSTGEAIKVTGVLSGNVGSALGSTNVPNHNVRMQDLRIDNSSDKRTLVQRDVISPSPINQCGANNRYFESAKSGEQIFTAPSTPGSYNMNVTYHNSYKTYEYIIFTCIVGGSTWHNSVIAYKSLPFTVVSPPIGYLDLVSNGQPGSCSIAGWSCDSDKFTSKLNVVLTLNGSYQTTIQADKSPSDTAVNNACGGDAGHRFSYDFPYPSVIWDSQNRTIGVTVKGVNASGNQDNNDKSWNSSIKCTPILPITIPTFDAVPATIQSGSSSTLSWTSTGADSCTIEKDGSPMLMDTFSTWSTTPNTFGGHNPQDIKYANGLFVAVGDYNFYAPVTGITPAMGEILTSPDGINWTLRYNSSPTHLNSVAYGNGVFVAVGWDPLAGPGVNGKHVYRSIDSGITWYQEFSPGPASSWVSVTYGTVAGQPLFVAVDSYGLVMTSPDGKTWTLRLSTLSAAMSSIAFGNGVFVTVGEGGVKTSPNGITWTARTPALSDRWKSVTFGNNMFVAVSLNGRIMTSSNGISWTLRTSPINLSGPMHVLYSVSYGGGNFIATGQDGYGDAITVLSKDGITWTANSDKTHVFGHTAYGNNTVAGVGGGNITYVGTMSSRAGSMSSGILTQTTPFSITCSNTGTSFKKDLPEVTVDLPVPISSPYIRKSIIVPEELEYGDIPVGETCDILKDGTPWKDDVSGSGVVTMEDVMAAVIYKLQCTDGSTDELAYEAPKLNSACNISQTYVNRQTTLTMTNPDLDPTAGVSWTLTEGAKVSTMSGNPKTKIFTTVGTKTITAVGMLKDGKTTKCSTTTIIKLAPTTGGEI